jgi:hypothetical protein
MDQDIGVKDKCFSQIAPPDFKRQIFLILFERADSKKNDCLLKRDKITFIVDEGWLNL